MKFLKLFNNRLMGAAEDLSGDGGGFDDGGIVDDGGSDTEALEDNESIFDNSWKDEFKEMGLDPAKYGIDDNDEVEEEADSQESEKVEGTGQNTDEKSFLDQLNSGLVHNELPFKVESVEEARNFIQMGKDYTLKTQSLSEERKAFETEASSTKEELNAAINEFNIQYKELEPKLQEMQELNFTLEQLKVNAPDIYEEVQRARDGVKTQFANPIINQQLAKIHAENEAIRAELAEARKGISSKEDKLTLDKFESEKTALAATEQSMKELGVAIDWKAAKDEWVATGMPLKNVVGSLYFESLAKAQASKSKVATTQAKIAARPTGGAGASRPGAKAQAIDPKLKGVALAEALLKRYSKN